jgi:hypothetical protein
MPADIIKREWNADGARGTLRDAGEELRAASRSVRRHALNHHRHGQRTGFKTVRCFSNRNYKHLETVDEFA